MREILQAADAVADPIGVFLQYGVLGAFAFLLVIYTRGSIAREREKADRAEAQVKELNDYIRTELLPSQVQASVLYKQVSETLQEAVLLISEIKYRDTPPRVRRGPQ